MAPSEYRVYSYIRMKEEYIDDPEKVERKYKKEEERFATIKYRSKLISRIITKTIILKVKRFKQKMDGRS